MKAEETVLLGIQPSGENEAESFVTGSIMYHQVLEELHTHGETLSL